MTNSYELKQFVPYQKREFPFTALYIQPTGKQVLHLHWHDDWEIIYLQKGKAVFHIGTESVTAHAGDLLFINKGLIHTAFSLGNTEVEYYALVFHPSLVGNIMQYMHQLQVTVPYTTGEYILPLHITKDDPYYSGLVDIVERLIQEYEEQSKGFQVAISSILHLLLVYLVRYYPVIDRPTPLIYNELNEKFKELISYIEENYQHIITVERAAEIVNLSSSHFCRTFKKITGKTLVEYINLYRVNVAERLLLETDIPITQITFEIGFSSINYFSKVFKDYKSISPSQYRKQVKSSPANIG